MIKRCGEIDTYIYISIAISSYLCKTDRQADKILIQIKYRRYIGYKNGRSKDQPVIRQGVAID